MQLIGFCGWLAFGTVEGILEEVSRYMFYLGLSQVPENGDCDVGIGRSSPSTCTGPGLHIGTCDRRSLSRRSSIFGGCEP